MSQVGNANRVKSELETFLKSRPSAFQAGVNVSAADTAPALVAVSGGVDSTVLLHALLRVAPSYGIRLHVVHVNHGIRSAASADQKFVENLCHRWGVPVTAVQVSLSDILAGASNGIEADARLLRYNALTGIARSLHSECVFLAHHADDQIETVLWRITRGTSLRGVSGMSPCQERNQLKWLRPLLTCTKTDILAYANLYQISYVEDETNTNLDYTRNYLRREVVPKLRCLQPNLARRIGEFAEAAREEDEYLDQLARDWVRENAVCKNDGCRVRTTALNGLPRPLQRRVIHILLYCLATEDWTRAHVEGALALASSRSPSAVLNLPQNIRVRREYDWLAIGSFADCEARAFCISWPLQDAAVLTLPAEREDAWMFTCRRWQTSEGVRLQSKFCAILLDVAEVTIQTAATTERIELLGMDGSKKVQDVFVDQKVPRHRRTTWPALYHAGQLVWLPGLARSRHLLVDPSANVRGWVITARPPDAT